MTDAAPARRNRFWLFAPLFMLVLVAAAWGAAWWVIWQRTNEAIDAWLAREASLGRRWECPERSVAGFPFRIEVRCPALALSRGEVTASIGAATAVAQVYRPRHVIAEFTGPLRVSDGQATLEGNWRALRASFRRSPERLERVSATLDEGQFSLGGLPAGPATFAIAHGEVHGRPEPVRGEREGAVEIAATLNRARLPILDALLGGADPLDADLRLVVTHLHDPPVRAMAEELDRWRNAGGKVEITALTLARGAQRLQGTGILSLDPWRRPEGRLDIRASDLGGLFGGIAGDRASPQAGAVLGGIFGVPAGERPPPAAGADRLKPLPPLRLENGRLFLGPFAVPGVRLAPIY